RPRRAPRRLRPEGGRHPHPRARGTPDRSLCRRFPRAGGDRGGAGDRAGMSEVLVVAGEPSGDRIAGLVASALAAEGVRCAGAGGVACRAAGVDTIVDVASLSAMGLADVVAGLPRVARALSRLALHTLRSPPRAALLVNFTEYNQRLGRALR